MNFKLQKLAAEHSLADENHRALRLAFGLSCANRVRHLLEQPRAVEQLDVLQAFVDGHAEDAARQAAAIEAAQLANYHRGSKWIEGTGHLTVYGYGGYAVNEPESFTPEYLWQVNALCELLQSNAVTSAR